MYIKTFPPHRALPIPDVLGFFNLDSFENIVQKPKVGGNRCSARVTSARNHFGTNLRTSAPNVKFGIEFHWNVKLGIMQKDLCRSLFVPKLMTIFEICAEVLQELYLWRTSLCWSSVTRYNRINELRQKNFGTKYQLRHTTSSWCRS